MNKQNLKKIFIAILAIYTVVSVSFYFLAEDQLKHKISNGNIDMPEADTVTPEIVNGVVVKQQFVNKVDSIEQIALVFTKFYREISGIVHVDVLCGEEVLYSSVFNVKNIPEQHRIFIEPKEPLAGYKDKVLTIRVSSFNRDSDGISLMMTRNAVENSKLIFNDHFENGMLCFSINGKDAVPLSIYYWIFSAVTGLLMALVFYLTYRKYLNGRYNIISTAIAAVYRYEFLISQLVARDFKSKYKRSILGVFWSFLNPLMTMTVQFLVFSTIFRVDTQNYPVYLICGVVCFSFFSECTTMCLTSISGNARLITKVYIPKYIFPLARTISSSINLAISMVPLLMVCLIMGLQIKAQALLFFYFLLCLVIFSLGVGMFLSALMVFFRDIQFLWTVVIQIWQYATPIFYPAEIIPDKYKFIIKFNPLYHFIGNARTCLMNGVSPEPMAYIYCLFFAVASLFIGSYVFKKTQDKFSLYL